MYIHIYIYIDTYICLCVFRLCAPISLFTGHERNVCRFRLPVLDCLLVNAIASLFTHMFEVPLCAICSRRLTTFDKFLQLASLLHLCHVRCTYLWITATATYKQTYIHTYVCLYWYYIYLLTYDLDVYLQNNDRFIDSSIRTDTQTCRRVNRKPCKPSNWYGDR